MHQVSRYHWRKDIAAVESAARQLRIQLCRNRRQIVPFSERFLSRESAISGVHLSQILAVGDRAIRSHGFHVVPIWGSFSMQASCSSIFHGLHTSSESRNAINSP